MPLKVVLLYPPHQSWPGTLVKPNGSLAYPMLGAALREIGVDVRVVDCVVGAEQDDLYEVFNSSVELPSGLFRTGLSEERILEEVADADIVGITSIFSDQETMVFATADLIREAFPDKLIISGGANARFRLDAFFKHSFDLVALSEAEWTIQKIAKTYEQGSRDFSDITAIAFKKGDEIVINPTAPEDVIVDLDELPMPAWDLLPNDRYWEIARPHGGQAIHECKGEIKYASIMTSLGCPFQCSFCHIASEKEEDSITGAIGLFRIKSIERVKKELDVLRGLGVKQVFIEDDSLFGRKNRGIDLLRAIKGQNFDIIDVNGVNLIHLFRKGKPDHEVIEALDEAGFKEIGLPFETANPRIMKKYISNKWDPVNSDVAGLIKICKERGILLSGHYMIGYPDETLEEVENTIAMAKEHMAAGLDSAHFLCVIPLPGTPIFNQAMKDGHLPADYNIDKMHWQKANMINTTIPPKQLEEIRQKAWEDTNHDWYQKEKKALVGQPLDEWGGPSTEPKTS